MTESVPLTWEEVARVYGRKIYNFAYRLTGNPDDAADLVQEVLLRVRRGLASYQPGSFEGWLWRITRNAFLDEVRKRNRRLVAPLPDEIDRWELASTPGSDVEYSRISLGDDIQKALLEVPIEFREAVVLCDVIGLSYEEIAIVVSVPIGTVRSRIHRGRKILKEAADVTHPTEMISAYLDGELTRDEVSQLQAHMSSCGRCVADMEALQKVRTSIRSLPLIELPPGLLGDAEPVVVPLRRNRGFWVGAAAAVVAAVIAVAADAHTPAHFIVGQ